MGASPSRSNRIRLMYQIQKANKYQLSCDQLDCGYRVFNRAEYLPEICPKCGCEIYGGNAKFRCKEKVD